MVSTNVAPLYFERLGYSVSYVECWNTQKLTNITHIHNGKPVQANFFHRKSSDLNSHDEMQKI